MSTAQNLAAYLPAPCSPLNVTSAPSYVPNPGEILVCNYAFAIQPLDAKMHNSDYSGAGGISSYPSILGTNLAGVVHAVGDGVRRLKNGDRVIADTAAYTEGDIRMGAWQRFVIVREDTVAKIGNASFEQAVAAAFPLQTAVAALQVHLGMGRPGTGSTEEKVLVWGAGGAVGTCAVSYAISVGHAVVATASPRDFERQKKLGALEIVDYRSPDAVDRLRAFGPFRHLITANGDTMSQKALSSLLQPDGGRFASVLGGDVELADNVERVYAPFSLTAQRNKEFAGWWYGEYLPTALEAVPVQYTKLGGGLSVLQEASLEVFEGKARGKMIINPQED